MKIGYACIALGSPHSTNHTCILKNATEERLRELIALNLEGLYKILQYNVSNQIFMYRISSEIIPFGSHEANRVPWWEVYKSLLTDIGNYIKSNHIRVSMHPGQYTVINSIDKSVVEKSIKDIEYHAHFLNALGIGREGKLVIHVGGVYGDKKSAMERWTQVYQSLSQEVRNRLVLENDEKYFTLEDVLSIHEETGVPVVYDNLHHAVNPHTRLPKDNHLLIMEKVVPTWKNAGTIPKVHYSNQDKQKKPGAHSPTIYAKEFLDYYAQIRHLDMDIMLEVKDKELSAIKCIQLLKEQQGQTDAEAVEAQWQKYKYTVLEKSKAASIQAEKLLRKKASGYVTELYKLIEDVSVRNGKYLLECADELLRTFEERCTDKELSKFNSLKDAYLKGKHNDAQIRRYIYYLAQKYHQETLLDSYYFL